MTALYWASCNNNLATVQVLLEYGASVDERVNVSIGVGINSASIQYMCTMYLEGLSLHSTF